MLKHILATCLATLSLAAAAQPMPVIKALPALSGTFRLVAPILTEDGDKTSFMADLFVKKQGSKATVCRMFGQVWSVRSGGTRDRYDAQRDLVAVPGSMRIVCPGEASVVVLGDFEYMTSQRGWSPMQTQPCLVMGSGRGASCQVYGVAVAAGTYGKWNTWTALPELMP